jgi:iron-sulfur cluster insertion protein
MSESTQLTLTPAAARHITKIITGNPDGAIAVRLEVLGGGCSGYQYKFGFDQQFNPNEDNIIERDGAKLVIDSTSLDLLRGSEVDYSESLMEAGFQVRNPNAKSSCGCGTSFAV